MEHEDQLTLFLEEFFGDLLTKQYERFVDECCCHGYGTGKPSVPPDEEIAYYNSRNGW